ncbi:hypothetical protein H6P1_00314 (plasmid) [Variovorax sp. PBL-H6]|nr:hypothetical protein H6P1_00314 [Variovorax sp. PBL-H6]VTU43579.1 hypothetical protein SRS16P1_00591 [Variovorax sp. SRS16]VTU43642.1 hypothetical protein E5P1_00585 [Variovorax sp. PBL-E5]
MLLAIIAVVAVTSFTTGAAFPVAVLAAAMPL